MKRTLEDASYDPGPEDVDTAIKTPRLGGQNQSVAAVFSGHSHNIDLFVLNIQTVRSIDIQLAQRQVQLPSLFQIDFMAATTLLQR